MATSVPVPIATPRSARASAGASLMPSPTIATTCPSACSAAIRSALPDGSTSARTWSIPTCAGDGAGGGGVVAGEHPHLQPERLQLRDGFGGSGLDRVGDRDDPDSRWPSTATYIGVWPAAALALPAAASGSMSMPAAAMRAPLPTGRRGRRWPPRRHGREWPRTAALTVPSGRGRWRRPTIASPSGCSLPVSAAAASMRSSSSVLPAVAVTAVTVGPAAGDGAGLVQHDGGEPSRRSRASRCRSGCQARRPCPCRP